MRLKFWLSSLILILSVVLVGSGQNAKTDVRSVTIITEPNAVVWMDDIRRGVTDEDGKLIIKPIPAGVRRIRIRASGFKEISQPLAATQRGEMKIALVKTTDQAEIAFQEAEVQSQIDRAAAIKLYRQAAALRPRYPEANLELARLLFAAGDYEAALKAIAAARRVRPVYPEASAVEGRIHNSNDEEDLAIAAFKRAIREGKGFQPEAHTGLGLLYKEKGDRFNATGDTTNSQENYELAARELKTAATQLSGAPDAKDIFQLLGDVYYRARRYADAVKTYEEFLKIFPDGPEATTVRSLLEQTRKEMNNQ